jgi:branched-chain amino acid transport system permease protein
MISVTMILQLLINGLLRGSIYALAAIGMTVIFGVMNIINFAHGALMMIAMYITYGLFVLLGVDPYLSLVISMPALFVFGGLIEKYLIHKSLDAPEINQFLITAGIMIFIENAMLFLFSPDFKATNVSYRGASISIGELIIGLNPLGAGLVAAALTGGLYLFFQKTDLGRALRAVAANKEAARLMGINLNYIYFVAFGIGSACVGAAGTIVSPMYYVFPQVGHLFLLLSFVIVILGGQGHVVGAFFGGLIIGVVESLCILVIPGSTKDAVVFAVFILVLLFKPSGLFGKREK